MNNTMKCLLCQGTTHVPVPTPTSSSAASSSSPGSSHPNLSVQSKKCNCSKFPTAEVVGAGPSGVIMTASNRVKGYPAEPIVRLTFVESLPLDIDFEPKLAPEVHICLDQDKHSRHAQCKHAQVQHWGDEVLPSLICPYMSFQWG
jgi:hypothetical protein